MKSRVALAVVSICAVVFMSSCSAILFTAGLPVYDPDLIGTWAEDSNTANTIKFGNSNTYNQASCNGVFANTDSVSLVAYWALAGIGEIWMMTNTGTADGSVEGTHLSLAYKVDTSVTPHTLSLTINGGTPIALTKQ